MLNDTFAEILLQATKTDLILFSSMSAKIQNGRKPVDKPEAKYFFWDVSGFSSTVRGDTCKCLQVKDKTQIRSITLDIFRFVGI